MHTPEPRLRVGLTALLLAALAAPGVACDPVTAKRTTEQFVPIVKGTRVEVSTENGWIKVVQGRPGIVAIQTHRRASSLTKGEADLSKMKVEVAKKDGVLRIQGTHPDDPKQRKYQLNFVLKVPPGTPVSMHSKRGALRIYGVKCDVKGKTKDGEVKAKNVHGNLDLSTHKGNITVVGRVPRFKLKSKVGDIRITLQPGTKPAGNSRAHSHHGDVSLTVGAKQPVSLVAKVKDGKAHCAYPSQTSTPHRLSAVIAGGGPQIVLQSKRGDVRIRKGP